MQRSFSESVPKRPVSPENHKPDCNAGEAEWTQTEHGHYQDAPDYGQPVTTTSVEYSHQYGEYPCPNHEHSLQQQQHNLLTAGYRLCQAQIQVVE